MSRRLDIYIHKPVSNARASHRVTRDANQAYDIKVRRIATGSDFSIRLFAASQEDAEKRAKERARSAYSIPPDKYRELESKGVAVFRIVSSKVSPDQSKPNTDSVSDAVRRILDGKVFAKDAEWQVDLETSDGRGRGVRVQASSETEAKQKAEADNPSFKAKAARKMGGGDKSFADTIRDTLDASGATLYQQSTMAQLRQELSDWKRELKDSTKPADVTYAQKQISEIEKEMASRRSGDKSFADTIGALIGGNHRPEGKHAKDTPIATDADKPDKNANSKAGKQRDQHGTVTITWKEDGWYYSGGGASDGPFNTSEEAFKAASAYGG